MSSFFDLGYCSGSYFVKWMLTRVPGTISGKRSVDRKWDDYPS